jgi:uncharacterized membrane protein
MPESVVPDDGATTDDLSPRSAKQVLETEDVASEASKRETIRLAQFEAFAGPLPPPKTLKEYESIRPGFAMEILRMAQKEQDFRHRSIFKEINGINYSRYLGQFFGFFLGLASIGGAVYLLANGVAIGGYVTLVSGLGALVWAFAASSKRPKNLEPNVDDDV